MFLIVSMFEPDSLKWYKDRNFPGSLFCLGCRYPWILLNNMAGPSRVGRSTVPPAPINL